MSDSVGEGMGDREVFPPDLEGFRRELQCRLPDDLARAIRVYRRFSADCPAEDPRAFAAYQAACRASLAHIQVLLRLVQWAEGTGSGVDDAPESDDLERLVREAEAAVSAEGFEPD